MGGLFRCNVSYILHTMFNPSSCGMLVYRLVTFIDTSIKLCPLQPSFSL